MTLIPQEPNALMVRQQVSRFKKEAEMVLIRCFSISLEEPGALVETGTECLMIVLKDQKLFWVHLYIGHLKMDCFLVISSTTTTFGIGIESLFSIAMVPVIKVTERISSIKMVSTFGSEVRTIPLLA